MARTLPAELARSMLAGAQRLAGPAREDGAAVAEVVRAMVGLQAQDAPAAALGVRARLAGATASAVARARFEERSVARVWCMRGTIHLVPAEDARWLVELLGPVGLARGRRRRAQMGVDTPEALAAVRAVVAEGGALTRHEIAAAVRARGVRLADDPQAAIHLVMGAALHGHICEGVPQGREPAYLRVEDWLAPAPAHGNRDAALAELARRHAHAHPPAGPEDFAAWSGLSMRDAHAGFAAIAHELEEVQVLGRTAWVPRGLRPAPPATRLLPAFDGILLGHRDRALTVAPEHARDVLPGGGILRPTLLVDGRVEGTWRLERGTPEVAPFGGEAPGLAAELADVVRFRGG